jgi:hypothetical protein
MKAATIRVPLACPEPAKGSGFSDMGFSTSQQPTSTEFSLSIQRTRMPFRLRKLLRRIQVCEPQPLRLPLDLR